MATKQTAAELCTERREDIARVIDWISLEIQKYASDARTEPLDFSDAGDLGHIRQKLIETLAFASNNDPEDIENLLGDARLA